MATVTHPDNVLFVMFYVDNLPIGTDAIAPFNCDLLPTGRGAEYHLTATPHSRFASSCHARVRAVELPSRIFPWRPDIETLQEAQNVQIA